MLRSTCAPGAACNDACGATMCSTQQSCRFGHDFTVCRMHCAHFGHPTPSYKPRNTAPLTSQHASAKHGAALPPTHASWLRSTCALTRSSATMSSELAYQPRNCPHPCHAQCTSRLAPLHLPSPHPSRSHPSSLPSSRLAPLPPMRLPSRSPLLSPSIFHPQPHPQPPSPPTPVSPPSSLPAPSSPSCLVVSLPSIFPSQPRPHSPPSSLPSPVPTHAPPVSLPSIFPPTTMISSVVHHGQNGKEKAAGHQTIAMTRTIPQEVREIEEQSDPASKSSVQRKKPGAAQSTAHIAPPHQKHQGRRGRESSQRSKTFCEEALWKVTSWRLEVV